MIQIHNLTYRYHNGFTALSDINCSISTGIHLLLGENGAGKTTFMHIIAGLRTPTQGSCACIWRAIIHAHALYPLQSLHLYRQHDASVQKHHGIHP